MYSSMTACAQISLHQFLERSEVQNSPPTANGEKKVTTMLLKVDLQCCKCYKKVKKLLCKFPYVRDQVFDEKTNTVTIKVVCCSPEKIRDKIRCKGGACIKSIEIILDSEQDKTPEKPPVQSIVSLGLALGYSCTCWTKCCQGCGCGSCKQMCYGNNCYCGRPICDGRCGCGGCRPCSPSWSCGECRPCSSAWSCGECRPCSPIWSCGECFSDENPSACSNM